MEILPKLFGSKERVKLLRLFLLNPTLYFSPIDISRRAKVSSGATRRELMLLEEIGFVVVKKLPTLANGGRAGKKDKNRKKAIKNRVWQLNADFFFAEHLKSIFCADFLAGRDELVERFKSCGKIKLVALSGLFIQGGGTRADLLIVGDDLRRSTVENIISTIESEIGQELTYAILDTRDYLFRLGSSDRFVRDIIDYPHRCLIDRLDSATTVVE